MPLDPKRANLLARANRAFGQRPVAEVVAKVRAIIGPPNIPDSETSAQDAWDKLREGAEDPTAQELAALELVIRLMRPAPLSLNGRLADLPDQPGHNLFPPEMKDRWSAFREKVQPVLYSIGRIDTKAGVLVGTGFVVAAGLLATNRHVLGALTYGAEVLAPGQARVTFQHEFGAANSPAHIAEIQGVAAIHPTLDMVLLRIPADARPAVGIEPAAVAAEHAIVAIGYPARDAVRNPLFLDAIYQNKYEVKRAALGEVLDGTLAPVLFHDASTTGGNSGSPLFSMASGRVAGIHRAGFFMYRNEGVDADHLRAFIAASI